jgi:two-component system sensor histidine kinase UhpB
MLTRPLTILIIEDNAADVFLIEEMLRSSRLSIANLYTCDRSSAACELLKAHDINLILLDLSLPDTFGIESFLKIKSFTQKIPVIILTGLSDSGVALETLQQGAQDYLVKGEFSTALLTKSAEYSIERKKVEEKILASEEKYRQLFYKNPFPALIYDLNSMQILEVNDAAMDKYGYEKEEFINLTIQDIYTAESFYEMQAGGEKTVTELHSKLSQHRKKNGEMIITEVTSYRVSYFEKAAVQVQINDVTEKIRLESQLAQQQEVKQRQITDAVLRAQEKERKGIGQELHDNINQILAASKLYFDESLVREKERIQMIQAGNKNLTLAMEEIRKLSKALIIPGFIKSGLKQSLQDLITHILEAKNISVTLDTGSFNEDNLGETLKINLYRIIQEQLNNILKYAEASAVIIRIHNTTDTIFLSINDNGKGFDINARRHGVGITNINSRAVLFNGKVEIDSSPGNGCRLSVMLNSSSIPQQAA